MWQRKRFFDCANQKSEPVPTLEMSRAQIQSLIADWTVAQGHILTQDQSLDILNCTRRDDIPKMVRKVFQDLKTAGTSDIYLQENEMIVMLEKLTQGESWEMDPEVLQIYANSTGLKLEEVQMVFEKKRAAITRNEITQRQKFLAAQKAGFKSKDATGDTKKILLWKYNKKFDEVKDLWQRVFRNPETY